ncbi:MAG: calcium-binding protein, partial [Alphaproteobacteria bacterium]
LTGSARGNTIAGFQGNDTISGGAGDDRLSGDAGDDVLNGGVGADTLTGGKGNDIYVVDGDDTVFESSDGGTDGVQSDASYTLGANVENLILTGTAVSGKGNASANVITGNAAANVIVAMGGDDSLYGGDASDYLGGGAGDDVLNGGAGSDKLFGRSGSDVFVFDTSLSATNRDKIGDFSVKDDTIQLDHAIFTMIAAGTLDAGALATNTSGNAADASDRIIYETDTGKLFYDPDGTGSAAKVQFALIDKDLALTHADFFILASS